jgi:hypothetical protein
VKRLPWVVFWAIAFAYVESAVVEYMRAIYYPLSQGGFQFPVYTLKQLAALGDEHTKRLAIELGRELATLVMLATLGLIAGKNRREAWAHFMVAFGVWDIFYYLWLKLFLNWPSSLMTWDLLFLVPVPWVSPALAPVIISVVMIACGIVVLHFEGRERPLVATWRDWLVISGGGAIVIVSFCWDYTNTMDGGVPNPFLWPVFGVGLLLSFATFVSILLRNRKKPISQ